MGGANFPNRSALSIALIYACVGGLWILLSDKALALIFQDQEILALGSLVKGWLYVGITALLLYFLISQLLDRVQAAHQHEIDSYVEKQHTLDLFKAIMDNSDDAIFAKDRQGRYLLINNAARRFLGREAADLLGQDDRFIFPPDKAAIIMAAGQRVMATGKVETNEEILDFPSGKKVFLITRGPLRAEDGSIVGIFGISRDISTRKQVELALQESEKRLRLLIELSPAALAMFDRNMRYLAVSNRWLADFGLRRQDVIDRNHYELFPEIDEAIKAIHQRGLAGETVSRDEDYFERADGSAQWLRWEMRPWLEPNGAIGGIVIFSDDITQRKLTEIALRESEHRFQDIVEASADWVWEVDTEFRFIFGSASVKNLLGYTTAEMIGKTPFDLMPPGEAKRVQAKVQDFAARRVPFRDLEHISIHKDGHPLHIASNGTPVINTDGTLLGYRGLDRDVTAEQIAEHELRDAKDMLRAVINTIPDLIWLKDTEGRYLTCNPRFEAFLGVKESEIIGKTAYDFLPSTVADGARERDHAAIAAGGPKETEEEVVFASDGHRETLLAIRTPYFSNDNRLIGVLGIAHNITHLKAAEETLRARNKELERFNRATVGRELDIIEMKLTINALSRELGRMPPFPLTFLKSENDREES